MRSGARIYPNRLDMRMVELLQQRRRGKGAALGTEESSICMSDLYSSTDGKMPISCGIRKEPARSPPALEAGKEAGAISALRVLALYIIYLDQQLPIS